MAPKYTDFVYLAKPAPVDAFSGMKQPR